MSDKLASNHQKVRLMLGEMLKAGEIKSYVLAMNCDDGQVVMANTKDRDKRHFYGLQHGVTDIIRGWE